MPNGSPAPYSPPRQPAPPAYPVQPSYPASPAAVAPAAPREAPRLHPAWSVALLVGAGLVALSPLMNLADTVDGMDGDDKSAYITAVLGRCVLGIALLGVGAWSSRASWGARAALLIAGAYFLLQGTGQALIGAFFGDRFGFGL